MLTSEGMKTLRQESFFKENRITKEDLNQSSPKIVQQYLAEVNCNGDEENGDAGFWKKMRIFR